MKYHSVPNDKKWKKFADGIGDAAVKAGIKEEEFLIYLIDFVNEMLKASGKNWNAVLVIKDNLP